MSMLRMLPALEVGLFNLITIHRCCRKKYSNFATAAALCLWMAFLLALIYIFRLPLTGDGKFSLGGLVYLLPLKFLYDEKLPHLFVIVCMSWVYTMSGTSLSVQAAGMISPEHMTLLLLLLQTAYFLVTMRLFYRRIVPRYIYIFRNVESFGKGEYRCLALNSCLSFVVLTCVHTLFSAEGYSLFRLLILALLVGSIGLSYAIIYFIIRDMARTRELKQISLQDALTGLWNRRQLWNDLQELCGTGNVFTVVFMDLDRFKAVNDQYGHLTGDAYLKHFAECGSRILQGYGRMYRFGGDEFAAVAGDGLPEKKLAELRECRGWEAGAPCPFNQVSLGTVVCRPPHPDAEEILRQVDRAMYGNKLRKKADKEKEREEEVSP